MMAAGKNRKPRRIQEVLDDNELNISELARQSGVRTPVAWRTVQGKCNNRKVLNRLLELGASEDILDLPPGFTSLPARPPAPAWTECAAGV